MPTAHRAKTRYSTLRSKLNEVLDVPIGGWREADGQCKLPCHHRRTMHFATWAGGSEWVQGNRCDQSFPSLGHLPLPRVIAVVRALASFAGTPTESCSPSLRHAAAPVAHRTLKTKQSYRRAPAGKAPVAGETPQYTQKRTGKNMSLITIVLSLIVAGVLLWLINTYIPMDGKIKKIINIVVVVVVIVWLLNVFGVMDHLRDIRASIKPPAIGSLASEPAHVMSSAM